MFHPKNRATTRFSLRASEALAELLVDYATAQRRLLILGRRQGGAASFVGRVVVVSLVCLLCEVTAKKTGIFFAK